ncbi:hypothetical protein LINPERHAP2_LOCUS26976 [Linum perenne]
MPNPPTPAPSHTAFLSSVTHPTGPCYGEEDWFS